MARPFWAVPELELARYARKNRHIYEAWQEMNRMVGRRDVRGARLWVFTLGWLAGLQYHKAQMAKFGGVVEAAVAKEAAEFGRTTGLDILE